MKKLTTYATFILFALWVQACNPNFYLKKNVHVETLKTHLSLDKKKAESYKDDLEVQYREFITTFNNEQHAFKIKDTDSASADMVLHVKYVSIPSNGLKAAAYSTSAAIMVLVPVLTKGKLFIPVWTRVQNATRIDYKLSSALAKPVKGQKAVVYNTARKWGKKAAAARRHNRYFSAQLGDFFDNFEREYRKKNQSK